MTTILVVDSDARRVSRVGPSLERAGFAVRHVTSAFEALTSIERLRPEVVLTRWETGGMTAAELVAVLRQDDSLGPIKTVLLVERDERAAAAEANGVFDLVLGCEDCAEQDRDVGDRISSFLEGDGLESEQEETDDFSISGHFGLLDLADLVQTVCSRRKTGKLALTCGNNVGSVTFDAGLVRHARYRGLEGRTAFARLFGELRDCGRASFSFAQMTPEQIRASPRTIGQPPQLLLLELAVAQDEGGRRREPSRDG